MTYKIILLTIGIAASLLTILLAAIFPFFAPATGIVAAYCFLRTILWPMADRIVNGVYSPAGKNNGQSFLFDRIASLISKQDYEGAVKELEEILKKDNFNYMATSMLAGLYAKKLAEPQKSIDILRSYLEKKNSRASEDTDMVLMFADLCSANNMPDLAVAAIEKELQKKYPPADVRSLELRFAALKKAVSQQNRN